MLLKIRALIAIVIVAACSSSVGAGQPYRPLFPHLPTLPQWAVVCTGWHALCSLATDCKIDGDVANCDCWKVNEPYIVIAIDIQDPKIKQATLRFCTNRHPCDVDEAPVCKAIREGKYTIDHVKYEWVSTYSYRGWCENWNPKECEVGNWADCMTYPCIENQTNTERPLTCQCRLVTGQPFVGSNGGCVTQENEVMSTINLYLWDFKENKFTLPMPGYEYVQGACAPISSDSEDSDL